VLQIEGGVVKVEPYNGCAPVVNANELKGKIGLVQRGDCMFIEKVCSRHCWLDSCAITYISLIYRQDSFRQLEALLAL
jgi:hypothetical protein